MSINSLEETRFTSVYGQQSDSSCGIAAVSSLSSLYWGIEVSEDRLAELLFAEGREKRHTLPGVSMYDMKVLLERLGFIAVGFELSYSELYAAAKTHGPLIVHLNSGVGHFALYFDEVGGFAVLGDPSRGCLAVAMQDFLSSWSNTALAVLHPDGKLDGQAVARAAGEAGGRLSRLLSWSIQ